MESQWVTFKLGRETFGFEIQFVKEMLRLPQVHSIPKSSTDNLGVILLRSEVIPVFDLRLRFNMESAQQIAAELVQMLRARLQDHENWLTELENSVKERREFTLTTDPHACKFGQWYDQFTTTDAGLMRILQHFDEPHRQIHDVCRQVKDLEQKQDFDAALSMINTTRGTILVKLTHLFNEAIEQVESSALQSLIVIGSNACTLGVAVDEIHSVITCNDNDIQAPDSIPGIEQFGGLIGLLPQKGSDQFIMLLDPVELFPQLIARHREAPVMA
jgi:purine-binding chemotaxis protein CheW